MIYYHYTQTYNNTVSSAADRNVRKVLEEYSNQESLKGLGKVSSFTGGVYVLKIKTPYVEVILEEQKLQIDGRVITVYFIRGFKNGLQDYVEIRDGKWLNYNPLPEFEIESFIATLAQKENQEKEKELPPVELLNWQSEYRLKVDYDIYESESWVKFAFSNSVEDGMKEDEAKLFRLVLLEVFKAGSSHIGELIISINNIEVWAVEYNEMGIVYSKVEIEGKVFYLLHNGANVKTQNDHWIKVKSKENYQNISCNSVTELSSLALKAYPSWVVNEADLWAKIEKNNELGNLSLLPEQTEFLKGFKFPKYINGQAGSGKSTMLYYLFANAYYYKYAGIIKGDIIFLTENENLLKHTIKSVYDLLLFNPEFDLSTEHVAITNVDKHFYPLRKFLLDLLPQNTTQFSPERYLNFSKFKLLYERSNIANYIKNKYSAELAWFTISTYVYGNDLNCQITSENYEERMPKDGKEVISLETFRAIEKEIIKPFYEKLLNIEGYWDKIKLIKYLNENTKIQKKYDIIFCDEAQDFSRVELEFILKLSSYTQYNLAGVEQFPVVFAGDALQTVNPTGFRTEVLTSMIYSELTNPSIGFKLEPSRLEFTPTYNYRSSQAIVNLANAIQYYRKKNLGAEVKTFQTSKRPVLFENEHLNVFVDFESFSNDSSLQNKTEYKTIIVPVNSDELEEFKNDHSDLKNFKNVISAVDAKGIDFNEVVVYGFGDFKLTNFLEGYESRYFFNKLYVAVTRAQTELVIIDSAASRNDFWVEIVDDYINSSWVVNSENSLSTFEDIIILDANVIIQSNSNIVEDDAIRQKERGILEKNISLLQVASSHFIKIDNKKEYYVCLGEIEEIKGNWKRAAEYYLNKYVGEFGIEKAAQVYWNGKFWNDSISISRNLVTNDQQVRQIISSFFEEGILTTLDLKKLIERKINLRDILARTVWRSELIEKLILLLKSTSDSESILLISDLLEFICDRCDIHVWSLVAEKYYQVRQYDAALITLEKIGDESSLLYLKSKLEIAKRKSDTEGVIIYLGRLAIETTENKIELASEIIHFFNSNADIDSVENIYVKQYVYFAYLIIGKDELSIIKFAKEVESCFTKRIEELVNGYYRLLTYSLFKKTIYSFILERWVKTSYNNGISLDEINRKYKDLNFTEGVTYQPFSESEVVAISNSPSQIIPEVAEHIKHVRIKNFRRFQDVDVSNLGLFNIVVGDNNIGKTSLLEALLFTTNKQDYLQRLAFAYIDRSNIHPDKKETSKEVVLSYNISSSFLDDFINIDNPESNIQFEIIGKRSSRSYEIIFGQNHGDSKKNTLIFFDENDFDSLRNIPYSDGIKQPFMAYGKGFSEDLAQVYFSDIINSADANLEQEFLSNIKIFIPKLNRIVANPKDGSINIRDDEFSMQFRPLHQYGEGANKLFRILILLTLHKGKRLLIDEIDAGIHYTKFKQFWSIVLRIALRDNTQIVATTHNDECIRYFQEVLEDLGDEFKHESRVVQMKFVNKIKVRSFEYNSFHLAIEDGIDIRGGVGL